MTGLSPIGFVLAGGASRRMGRDKALLPVAGVPMARRVADALGEAGCSPVLAVGGDAGALAALGLPVVADGWPGEGPLGALATVADTMAARGWAHRDAVVVACDLPWLDAATVWRLIDATAGETAGAQVGAQVVCARTDRIEPLCARWSPPALAAARELFLAGDRSVAAALAQLQVLPIDVDAAALRNANSPSDLPGGSLPA